MNFWLELFFFILLYPASFIIFFVIRNAGNGKNGYCFGVQVQQEWLLDTKIEQIVSQYNKQMKYLCMLLACIPFVTFFTPGFSIGFSVWMLWMLAMIGLPYVLYMKANKKLRQWKQEKGYSIEEDEKWIGGLFYYNKEDKHSMVNARFGVGTTTNLARPTGKLLEIIGVVGLLAIPLVCGWIILEEYVPIELSIEQEMVIGEQLRKEYEIPVEKIENLREIEELPEWSKSNGTAMENLCKGTFYIRNVGKCEVFLNPQNTRFLEFEVEGKLYYMSGVDDAETQQFYKQIKEMQGE